MIDDDKTKEQPISELDEMRQQIAELEASEAQHKWAEEKLREGERHKEQKSVRERHMRNNLALTPNFTD